MLALYPDVAVTISQRRLMCVLDPALALAPEGFWLAQRLSTVFQVWLAREFCHIVENSPVYQHIPQKFHTDCPAVGARYAEPNACVGILQAWEAWQVNPAEYPLYYFADSLAESTLPENTDPALMWRFEAFSHSLDSQLAQPIPLLSAYRDSLALAAALPAAFILTYLPKNTNKPELCQQAKAWQIPVASPETNDAWLRFESSLVRQQLVAAGLAKLQWSGLHLAVLHIITPFISVKLPEQVDTVTYYESTSDSVDNVASLSGEQDYWRGTQGFWYPL